MAGVNPGRLPVTVLSGYLGAGKTTVLSHIMRQELVFIGQNLDRQQFVEELDNCLLGEHELLAGRELWQTLPDPFPVGQE